MYHTGNPLYWRRVLRVLLPHKIHTLHNFIWLSEFDLFFHVYNLISIIYWITHKHTHTHLYNGPLSGTTWVSQYQKGKTNLDLLKQEIMCGSGISWAICKSAPCSRQMTMPAPHYSVFYRPDALPAVQPTVSKHWRITHTHTHTHTHTRLTAFFTGLPGWAGTRKVKPIWILLKQETVSGSGCLLYTSPSPRD